ncbi:TonB-dependent receptor [Pseudomonas aeruginosa]|uniref:Neutral ceramidase n=1 Tax=Pseudomonas aeruginosa TaxID=287 RepID=A0A367MEP2_PSEAI|nr:TonB-dependent receptor [Pseudomonas aeruginosa]
MPARADDLPYRFGLGKADITGEAAEVGMMGYSSLEQKTAGIHMRQWARAFVIEEAASGRRLVYVNTDLGMIFQAVHLKVLARLKAKYPGVYDENNVMLAATHTHSGPGGFSHYAMYNLSVLGFQEKTFNAIVDGIVRSIERAQARLQPGRLFYGSGELRNASRNRSLLSHLKNPDIAGYEDGIDPQMSVLSFVDANGELAGAISWFPVHSTSMTNANHLISPDNKGYASYHWEHGYAGLSYSGYDSNYGSPAEDDVRLKMQQDRYAFASEIRDLEGPFTSLKLDAAYTKYEHKEIEDSETGTTFKNEGYEGRIEARHRPLGPLNGVVGAQFANSRFSALGEEAFVPHTETDSAALFALEEWKLSDRLDLSFGARLEHTRVDPDAKGNERFAENDGSQSFTTGSLSTGAVYKLTPIWSLAATLSYTERAPTFYELYANGPHAATGTYEVGDADADKEKAVSTDLALRFDNGVHKGSVGVFYSRFSNYIGLLASGRHRNEEGEVVAAGDDEALPEYLYSGVRADFYGVEAQDRIHLLESPYGNFDLELSGDYTRAKNKDTGEPLPRIAPLRLNTALIWELQQWQARVDVEHAASQHRVPEEELSTDGYTTLGASLGYNFDLGESRWLAFVKGTNLTNQTVRYASSILRDRVPAAGRGIEAGVKVAF